MHLQFLLPGGPSPSLSFLFLGIRQVRSFIHATRARVQQCSTLPSSTQSLLRFSPTHCSMGHVLQDWFTVASSRPGTQSFSFTSLSSTHELITDGADQPHSSPNLVNLGTVGFPRDIRIVEQGFEASLHRRNGSGCSKAPRPMTWKGRCGRSRCASVLLLGIARPYGRDAWSWPTYSSSFSHCVLSFVCLSISSLQEARIIDISGLPYM